MATQGVVLCEGCGTSSELFPDDTGIWMLRPADLTAFMARHEQCAARMGSRPCFTIHLAEVGERA
ncbi:MAG TPA: hypothetical protein VIA81_07295 [Acidimicrobiia bacterium]